MMGMVFFFNVLNTVIPHSVEKLEKKLRELSQVKKKIWNCFFSGF